MIGAIFATDEAGGFGNQGKIPWNVPEDYQHFKDTTMGGKIVMGKATFRSLPNLLPGRVHIIVSTTLDPGEGYTVYKSVQEVIDNEGNNFWVIGGPGLILEFHRLVGYGLVYRSLIYGKHKSNVTFPNFETVFDDMYVMDKSYRGDFEIIKYASKNQF